MGRFISVAALALVLAGCSTDAMQAISALGDLGNLGELIRSSDVTPDRAPTVRQAGTN